MANKRVMVIVAHPDDEVLGCGGTIARHADDGDMIKVLILADGVGSRSDSRAPDPVQLEARRRSARAANELLGVHEIEFHDYQDNRMDGCDLLDVVRSIEREMTAFDPSIVYTHHVGDVNVDHAVVHNAVVTACRPKPGFAVRGLWFFETPSSTEWRPATSAMPFSPTYFVDISATLPRKLAALNCYLSEMCDYPHPRSLRACENLAMFRGASVGVCAAEAFQVGRILI
ncbi:MAG: PIG-L deacetylase family protein [Gammaproteobacteria bacterium]|nr:PIG-L deacetylase family protein [Gammaproteobacteria bacterium]